MADPLSVQGIKITESCKRKDYLSWDEYFMSIALLSAMRSKDPVTQVGACIVNPMNKIIGIGYNGMPNGLHDDEMPWGKLASDPLANKYFYVCHAELNAILNKNVADTNGCTLYASVFPCNECAKVIIQSGIKKIIYFRDPKQGTPSNQASKFMLTKAGITFSEFKHTSRAIHIELGV